MNLGKMQHVDGGLISNSSHVSAVVQALLHTDLALYIEGDLDHSNTCVALLKCMPCAFKRLISSWRKTGMGSAAPFVAQWNSMLVNVEESKHRNAFEVLDTFICTLKMAFVQRLPKWTAEDLATCVVGLFFDWCKISSLECNLCGTHELKDFSRFIKLSSEISQLNLNDYFRELNSAPPELCLMCKRCIANPIKCDLMLGQYIIIHSAKPCSATFNLPFQLKVHSDANQEQLQFVSCIAQKGDTTFFISLCPDGRCRMFQNEKISNIALGRIASSTTLFKDCLLTIIYETDNKSLPHKTRANASKVGEKMLKVTGLPNLACDLYTNLPEPPKTRTVGTQTAKAILVDTCSQTDTKKKEPLVSYEKCTNIAKFQFFTGHDKRDFEALHDFVGGEKMIRYLKLNYNETTPTKIQESRVSSKDRLFMFLLRLRRGLPLEELAFIFNISVTYVGELCYVMTRLLFEIFKAIEDKVFISAAEQAKNMPVVMKPFKRLRVILDGASFRIQAPTNFQMQGNTYSEYKCDNVLVFIVGVSCHGSTIFCSDGFEGNMSDKKALLRSTNFLERLEKGDCVMVDRGFEVTAELLQRGVHVIKPPNKSANVPLNESDELFTKAVAAARIYVEHAIGDNKDNRLLQGTIPLTLLPVLPQLVYIAAFLRNFSTKVIQSRKVVVAQEEPSVAQDEPSVPLFDIDSD